ncbi:Uncharacterized protein QTN25_002558 [Entamoeba marina]
MLFLFLFSACALSDDVTFFTCENAYPIVGFPHSFSFDVDPNIKTTSVCGEDSMNLSSIWVSIANSNDGYEVITIETDCIVSFHTSCNAECVDSLPKKSTLTIDPFSTVYLAFKSNETVSFTMNYLTETTLDKPEIVSTLPYSKSFRSSSINFTCVDFDFGTYLSIPDMAIADVELNMCGSTATVDVALDIHNECVIPTTKVCEGDSGIIATFVGEPMNIQVFTGKDGFKSGSVNIDLTYTSSPICGDSNEFNVTDDRFVYTGTIFGGVPKTIDECNSESMNGDFVKVNGEGEHTFKLIPENVVKGELHIFRDCDMKTCFKNIEFDGSGEDSITLDWKDYEFLIFKVTSNNDENLRYVIDFDSKSEDDGKHIGVIIFVCVVIVISIIVIILGIVSMAIAIFHKKKTYQVLN